MTISPEALEKARSLVANYGSDPDGLLVGAIAAALQAERDAATPKLPDDLAGLVAELRDAARLNAGPLGPEARAEHRALTAIQSLVARNAELRAEIAALKKEAADVVRPFADEAKQWDRWTDQEHLVEDWNDGPDSSLTVGHLRAARSFLDKWEGRE